MPPKISVVTAVYNGEAYFSRAVPSILSQHYDDFEYIIIDDGSTDKTPGFLSTVAERDSRVRILSPGRIGFVRALNLGISHAKGEYVARQDFDDLSYPDRFSTQADYLDAHPSVGVVGAAYILADDNRGERYTRTPPLEHRDIVKAMAKYIPLAHTLVMFRREAWTQAGGYPEVDDIEDLRLWISLASLGWELANVPEILGEHWVHGASFWHQSFTYRHRQATLRKVQRRAISRLELPFWMHIYPTSRALYSLLPRAAKRIIRKSAGLSEQEVV